MLLWELEPWFPWTPSPNLAPRTLSPNVDNWTVGTSPRELAFGSCELLKLLPIVSQRQFESDLLQAAVPPHFHLILGRLSSQFPP